MVAQLVLDRMPAARPMPMPRAQIERWLADYVAKLAQMSPAAIDIERPFSHFELDSIATVEMTADIEDWLGVRLEPTLIWDYPTIARLATHLSDLKAAGR